MRGLSRANQTSHRSGAQIEHINSTNKSSNEFCHGIQEDVQSKPQNNQEEIFFDFQSLLTESGPGQSLISREQGKQSSGLKQEKNAVSAPLNVKLRDLGILYDKADRKYKDKIDQNAQGHQEDEDVRKMNVQEQIRARYENIKAAAFEAQGGKPDLLTQLYEQDGTENIWSILTDDITYCKDLKSKRQELKYVKNRHTAEHVKFQNSARKLTPNDDKYHAVHSRIVPTINLDSEVTATYIGSLKGSKICPDGDREKKGVYTMNQHGYTIGTTFDQKSKICILNDTGCAKAIINKRWLDKYDPNQELPRYTISQRKVKVGNGAVIYVNQAVRVTYIANGHIFEIVAIIMDCGQDDIDIVIGSKVLFELEANVNYETLEVEFRVRSRPISPVKTVVLEPHRTETIRMHVHDLPEDWTAHRTIAKLQDKNIKEWNYHTTELFVDSTGYLRVQVTNLSDTSVTFSKRQIIGAIDLRSAGYFHITRHNLVQHVQDQIMVLSDKDTVEGMYQHFLQAKDQEETKEKSENPKDPYPWLPKDDERRSMTDEEIITKYVDLSESVLTKQEKADFIKIMLKYRKAFSLREEIGMCSMPPVELELKDTTPFYIRPYAVKSEEEKEFIDQEMRKGCLLGYLKRGLSSYSSPIMVIPRKHSSQKYRLVTDFRYLNSRLVRLNPSLPLVRDTLRKLGESEGDTLSVIDLRDAYHTIRIAESSKKYCGITPYQGASTYLYQRLGMGLSVSPAIWCNFIERVMRELPSQDHHIAIMDDIMIHSKRADHMQQIINLFKVIIKHGLKISPKKCQFFRTSLVYMGHNVIIQDGRPCVRPVQTMLDAIVNLKPPTDVKGVRGFCGMVNFLHFYIKNIQIILAPLRRLTRVGVNFVWSDECKEAFEKAKQSIMKAPVLVLPNKHGLFQIESDTSIIGCGGALFQIQDGKPRLCGYYSKKLPEVVSRYGITELELLGLTCNVMAFRYLVLKRYFEVFVDHKCIESIWIAKTEPKTDRIRNCLEILSIFTFHVIYKRGREMYTADFLSRHPQDNEKDPVLPVAFLLVKDIFCQMETRSKRRARLAMEKAESAAYKNAEVLSKQQSTDAIITPNANPSTKQRSHSNITQVPIRTQRLNVPVLNEQAQGEVITQAHIQDMIKKIIQDQQNTSTKVKPTDEYEGENCIPIDLTVHGQLPSDMETDSLPLPEDIDKRQNQQLFKNNLKNVSIVRRTLPKQTELNKLLSKLSKTAIHNYNLPVSAMELITGYERSPYFKDIYKYLKTGLSNYPHKMTKQFQAMCQTYVLIQNLLFKLQWHHKDEPPNLVLCIPEKLVPYILYQYHDSELAGHQGITRTLLTLETEFFFPNRYQAVCNYIRSCHRCQATKNEAQKLPKAMHARIPANFKPFDRMSMDIKNMPKSSDGFEYILICTCDITNYVVAVPLKKINTRNVFEAIFQRIVSVFTKPTQIICDQASIFTSKLMDEITKMLKIKIKLVAKENHGANQTERYIQSINNILRKYLMDSGKNWPSYVSAAAYSMNSFVSPVTGYSPYEMVFGRSPNILGNLDYKSIVLPEFVDADQYVLHLRNKIKQMAEKVMTHRAERQQQQQVHEMRAGSQSVKLTKGDLVMLKRPNCSDLNPAWKKLKRDWVGPLRIIAVLTEDKYLLSDWTGQVVPLIAQRREVKPYYLRNIGTTEKEVVSAIREGAKVIELIHEARAQERTQQGASR